MKVNRNLIHQKFNGHCAYCGKEITIKQMQVDHIVPLYRNSTASELKSWNIVRGEDSEENYNPACARCNKWKSTFTVEQFRKEIELQVERMQRDSSAFRMATDFDTVEVTGKEVKFYYEKL